MEELNRNCHCWKRANTHRAALEPALAPSSKAQLRVGLAMPMRGAFSSTGESFSTECQQLAALGGKPLPSSSAGLAGNYLAYSCEPTSLCCAALLCPWLHLPNCRDESCSSTRTVEDAWLLIGLCLP